MNRDEILNQGRPIEPNCFNRHRGGRWRKVDKEEQWYKIGLYDGASSKVWHSIADGDLPKEDGEYIVLLYGSAEIFEYDKKNNYWKNARDYFYHEWFVQHDITHWMEIPKLD